MSSSLSQESLANRCHWPVWFLDHARGGLFNSSSLQKPIGKLNRLELGLGQLDYIKAEAHPSPDETTVVDVAVVHCTSDGRTRIGTAAGHLHGRVRMAAADAAACGKRDRLDRHMAAAAPVGAPAGTRFLPLVFEVHGGCTGDTAREIRHLLNAWYEQDGYNETRCAVNRHAWRYYIACMLAHAVQGQVRWLLEPMAASG